MIRIQREPYDCLKEIEIARSRSDKTGAVVMFEGVARDFDAGEESWLEFEHYPGMAERMLQTIGEEARAKFPVIDVRIIHRIGKIGINEGIVLVITSASHRGDAYDANRWCMEELKRRVPIWKREMNNPKCDGGHRKMSAFW